MFVPRLVMLAALAACGQVPGGEPDGAGPAPSRIRVQTTAAVLEAQDTSFIVRHAAPATARHFGLTRTTLVRGRLLGKDQRAAPTTELTELGERAAFGDVTKDEAAVVILDDETLARLFEEIPLLTGDGSFQPPEPRDDLSRFLNAVTAARGNAKSVDGLVHDVRWITKPALTKVDFRKDLAPAPSGKFLVQVKRAGQEEFEGVAPGAWVKEKDTIKTDQQTIAQVLVEGYIVVIGQDTLVTILSFEVAGQERLTVFDLHYGLLRFTTLRPKELYRVGARAVPPRPVPVLWGGVPEGGWLGYFMATPSPNPSGASPR